MSASWFRLWHDMPTDPKWRTIARASGESISSVIAVYLHILVSASNATERGRTQSFACEDVASALDMETTQIEAIVAAMQGRVVDDDVVLGWAKRQPAREDGAAERAKAWRERNKQQQNDKANARERKRTQENAEERSDTDTDTDTETARSKEPSQPKKRAAGYEPRNVELPACVSRAAWVDWCRHRSAKRSKLTPVSVDKQLRFLAEQHARGSPPEAIIGQSIRNGWMGLFELRSNAHGAGHRESASERVERRAAEIIGRGAIDRHANNRPALGSDDADLRPPLD